MRHLSRLICGAALLSLLQMPAVGQEMPELKAPQTIAPCCPPGHSFKYLDGRPLAFVVNGAGGSTTASDNLIEVNYELKLGLRVQMIPWCRHNAIFQDLVDHEAQLKAATRIACTVAAIRRDCPNVPIFFVGTSAGARVVLAAAEMLPPRSIDRIILLSPAVSSAYDLTTALKTATGGIDSFYSTGDGILEAAEERHALADGGKGFAAGRMGFHLASSDKNDMLLYRNVRQYRWTIENAGNGGHFAWTLTHNMKRVLPPLFTAGSIIVEPLPSEIRKMPMAK